MSVFARTSSPPRISRSSHGHARRQAEAAQLRWRRFYLGSFGNLQVSYGRQTTGRADERDHWHQPLRDLGRYGYLASRRAARWARPATDVFVNWAMPFGDRRTASMSVRYSPDIIDGEEFEAIASMQQSLPAGSGTGYYWS